MFFLKLKTFTPKSTVKTNNGNQKITALEISKTLALSNV